jgi:glycosyltransferase involved in cell wall biosynthesis
VLAANGVRQAETAWQGVDVSFYSPDPKLKYGLNHPALAKPKASKVSKAGKAGSKAASSADGRFVVFSGGKLEIRKGQDLVVAAFARFARTHPDATLATAWFNPWPDTFRTIGGLGYVQGVPRITDHPMGGQFQMHAEWLARNGVPEANSYCLNASSPRAIRAILRRADAALFTNRAEGGTNLVAMEVGSRQPVNRAQPRRAVPRREALAVDSAERWPARARHLTLAGI